MATTSTERAGTTADGGFEPVPVNVRIKISALWTAMLFVFAYVDLFSLYRSDVRSDIEAGELGGSTIGESFLLGTTIYVAIPALMVVASLVLPAKIARATNVALSIVYALTIAGGAIGEWNYYVLGSALEIVALAAIAAYAWTWPRSRTSSSAE